MDWKKKDNKSFKSSKNEICENYRAVTLLNTTYKILTILVKNRLSKYTEEILGQYQKGFRNYRCNITANANYRKMLQTRYITYLYIIFIERE